jgi:hypothetical protein
METVSPKELEVLKEYRNKSSQVLSQALPAFLAKEKDLGMYKDKKIVIGVIAGYGSGQGIVLSDIFKGLSRGWSGIHTSEPMGSTTSMLKLVDCLIGILEERQRGNMYLSTPSKGPHSCSYIKKSLVSLADILNDLEISYRNTSADTIPKIDRDFISEFKKCREFFKEIFHSGKYSNVVEVAEKIDKNNKLEQDSYFRRQVEKERRRVAEGTEEFLRKF